MHYCPYRISGPVFGITCLGLLQSSHTPENVFKPETFMMVIQEK